MTSRSFALPLRYAMLDQDPRLAGRVLFHEYFHSETGMGLGASHQTGWTGLVADLITSRRKAEVSE